MNLPTVPLPLPHEQQIFINGTFVNSSGADTIPCISPATEKRIANVARGTAEDVDRAVLAAKAALDTWGKTTGAHRAALLRKIAEAVTNHKKTFALLESADGGKPLPETEWDMDDVAGTFNYYANMAEELDGRQNTPVKLSMDAFDCRLRYEPVGVIGIIVPFNYPMLMLAWKVAPAIAAGCTVVVKPSENTSLTANFLGEVLIEVGLPAGVVNIVPGYGAEAGNALVNHPLVDAVAFTGSTRTGSSIMGCAAKQIKNVSLELGGKGSLIIFDDVDVEQAVEWIMFGVFWSNGQICSSTSRCLLHAKIVDRVLARLKEEAEKVKIGNPLEDGVKLGPIVSKAQYDKVMDFIASAKAEGATLLTGGSRPPHLPSGYFVQPTVFYNVQPNMRIWKEEIFGPVLSVRTFETEQEAVDMANDSEYGLGAAVMSKDLQRCERIVSQLRHGIVWVNCSQPCFVEAPWGGMKKSGVGRDLGPYGFERFLEVKQVTEYKNISTPWGWYIQSNL